MQPSNKRSIDGFRRPKPNNAQALPKPRLSFQPPKPVISRPQSQSPKPKPQPEYRADHELPAPKPVSKLPVYDIPQLSLPGLNQSHRLRRWLTVFLLTLFVLIATAFVAGYAWLQKELSPVSEDTTTHVRVTIPAGSSTAFIGEKLEKDGVIKSRLAFSIYIKLSGKENKLKAGAYSLQPSLSTPAIIDHLVDGKADTFTVTFLPGDTLANGRKILLGLGYTAQEVDTAFAKTYDRPLFATKPISSDLEGYLYGETIEFDYSASVESILEKFFDQFENFVNENNLVAAYKKQGLTLYGGITLASIVQREVPAEDMPAVARVFLNRLKIGMTLGSDVTYQYAAKKLGVEPSPALDSPYNTRKYPGLPPGPIATPGNSALLAVAQPAKNDYLYFLSGDDGKAYFSKTDEGHQRNIVQHCQEKCRLP